MLRSSSTRPQQQQRWREIVASSSSAINNNNNNNNNNARSSSTSSASSSPPPPLPGSAPRGFSAPDASQFRLVVLGDLHYDPRDEEAFSRAREQLARALKDKAAVAEQKEKGKQKKTVVSRLVQLGDLGASSFAPGTPPCFEHAREFLGSAAAERESFGAPPALVAGNHDLEGNTFDEIGLRFTSLSDALSISSYSGDSSDEEDEDEGEEGGGSGGGGRGGKFGDNSRRRGFPSALAAAEAADAANLEAWRSTFGQHHFWRAELGPAVLLGLSTTRFRSNSNSVHEVHLDGEQFRWLEGQVSEAEKEGNPVIIFTHAPPAGCGLRVVQAVHVRNRCAYLNHGALDGEEWEREQQGEEDGRGGSAEGNENASSSSPLSPPPPDAFIRLVERHPNVRLWFSGHYHLSHNYLSSVSVVNNCAFAQVGVIGPRSTRDGLRQSRVLDGDAEGFQLFSLDHETGRMRLDARGEWWGKELKGGKGGKLARPPRLEVLPVPEDELLDPAADVTWLSSQVDCGVGVSSLSPPGAGEKQEEDISSSAWPAPASAARAAERTQWLPAGGDALLALSPAGGDLLEYSSRMRCPVGFVLDKLPRDRGELRARLVSAEGEEVFPNFNAGSGGSGSDGEEGSSLAAAQDAAVARAAAVEVVVAATGEVVGRRGRNAKGSFYHVYQPNKWRKKVAELEAEAKEKKKVAAV